MSQSKTEILESSEAAMLSRAFEAAGGPMSKSAAEEILKVKFPKRDVARMNALIEKAQERRLTEQEKVEAECYSRVGHFLEVLQSRARISLKSPAKQKAS
ncbi:MAG: hypothetical protein L0Z50_13545 [Verrucomicrobiales bacterium]|nr:hypothetical protein [Verrucomicrobiales bacterium]